MWLASWSSRETDVSFPGALDLHVGALGCCSYNEKFPANAIPRARLHELSEDFRQIFARMS